MLLYVEHWSGAAPGPGSGPEALRSPPPAHGFGTAAPDLPRPSPQQLSGAWNVWGVGASPLAETDPLTGETQ